MNNQHTLELILTQHSRSLGKISSTCKEWNTTTGEYREEEKLKYIKDTSLDCQDNLIQVLELEMYRCGTAFYDNDVYNLWRDDNDDWEEQWYDYRVYDFFYKDYMRSQE
jgi:hypothetical protein